MKQDLENARRVPPQNIRNMTQQDPSVPTLSHGLHLVFSLKPETSSLPSRT